MINYKILNGAEPGATSNIAIQQVFPFLNPKYDIFMIVSSFGLGDIVMGHDPEFTKTHLREFYRTIHEYDPLIRIFQFHNQVFQDRFTHSLDDDQKTRWSKLYEELADECNITLLPFLMDGVVGDPDLFLPDGIHPNEDGMKIITENVWKAMEPYFREIR